MALAADRMATTQMADKAVVDFVSYPVRGSTHIFKGAQVAIDATGYLVPAAATAGLFVVGRSEANVNNTGADGAVECLTRRGTFPWANSAGGDAIAQTDVEKLCFAVDDQTVALTDALGTRPVAGIVKRVETGKVWVECASVAAPPAATTGVSPKLILTLPLELASIADGQAIGNVVPGFAGRVLKTAYVANKPATTAAKLTTLTPRIGSTAITGGVVALTTATATPQGNVVAGTAITALNTFTAAQALNVQASSTTAFVEGNGSFVFFLG